MMATPTAPPATSGIGWSNGMAAQVSLPNMLLLRPWGYVRIWPAGLRARSRWQYLCGDLLEQIGRGRAIGERTCIQALFGERGVAGGVKSWAGGTRSLDPGGKLLRPHRVHVEMHARKAVTTKVA